MPGDQKKKNGRWVNVQGKTDQDKSKDEMNHAAVTGTLK